MPSEHDIRAFLSEGHPPGSELDAWGEKLRAFGDGVPSVCLDILEYGDFALRPAAIYGLRAFGYEAWAEGYWKDEHYKVRTKPNSPWRIIFPHENPNNPFEEA